MALKVHQIYIRKFIALFVVLFLAIAGILYFWIKSFYLNQTKDSLLLTVKAVSLQMDDLSKIDLIAKKVKDKLDIRLTIIDKTGKVLAESHKDKVNMDNHKYREEIVQAKSDEYGYIVRHSDTLNKEFLYVARKHVINNETYFIRLSKELAAIKDQFIVLGVKVIFVLVLFFILLFYMTFKIGKQVQYETNNILQFLINLTKKRKKQYIRSEFSQEFYAITKLLTKVSKILTKQDKQKTKYTNKLKTINSQKDDIISAISHEFKNPIAVINGYSQTIIDDPDMNKAIRAKFLQKIHKSGLRLSGLIDTLRLSIKLDEGKQPIKFKNMELNSLAKDCIDSLKMSYKNREIELSGLEELKLDVDEVLFTTALTNLIENALKYSEDKVFVDISKDRISVRDTGIGISEKNINNITDKFFRVSNNGWNNSLGLGLSIVSNVVNMHNFTLEIESVENQGSTFSIKF